jgi:hypothetical protein
VHDLRSAAFTPDGTCILASSWAYFSVNCWSVSTGKLQPCFADIGERQPHIRKTLVAPNGRAIIAINAMETMVVVSLVSGYRLEFWDVAHEMGVNSILVGSNKPQALACSFDGHRVLAGFPDGQVSLYGL